MKEAWRILSGILAVMILIVSEGCIHEHPDMSANDPAAIEMAIELSLNLKWGEDEMSPFYGSRARDDDKFRVFIEVGRNGTIIGKDSFTITEEEFKEGTLLRKLPFTLGPYYYDVAVWVDKTSSGNEIFDTQSLQDIGCFFNSITDISAIQCGYAADALDLRKYNDREGARLIKEMSLQHPGARFKLVTTDMREFVERVLDDIENGETYTLRIDYATETADRFNAFTGYAIRNYIEQTISGPLKLTYSIYRETDIAEGYIFCNDHDILKMCVSVYNSARVPVVMTGDFSFEVNRGRISIVTGEFLSEIFESDIAVDTRWEGEINIEI